MFVFSQYLRAQGVLAAECLFAFLAFPLCLSMGAPCLSSKPQFLCEGAFLLPMLCTEVPSFFSPWGYPSRCTLCPIPSDSSCKHTSAFSNVNTRGFSAYLFSVAGEAAQFSEVGEHIEAPPCIPHLVYIYSSLFSSPYISVWGTYVLTSMFEWMGVFNPALSPGV